MEPVIRQANSADRDKILQLLNSVFSEQQRTTSQRDTIYWNWKFGNSPFGKSILTVAESEGKIVAVANLWPWEFVVRGKTIKAFQPCDSVVSAEARGKGLFRKLRAYSLEEIINSENNVSFLFNFPNKQSISSYLSLGWDFVNKIPWFIKVFKPLQVLKSYIGENQSSPFPLEGRFPVNPEKIYDIQKRHDNFDGLIKINRTNGFYEWRYLSHPFREYGSFIVGKGKQESVVIFTVTLKGEIKEMVIVDIIGSKKSSSEILKEAIKIGKSINVGLIAVISNPLFNKNDLARFGFIRRRSKNMVVLPLALSLERKVLNLTEWSLMACLHDSI